MTLTHDSKTPDEARRVLQFWLEAGPDRWFEQDDAFDAEVRLKLGALYERAREGLLDAWVETQQGSLALLILLDQAPRNMFRGDARAFSTDPHARAVADRALARGWERGLPQELQRFFTMPLMHSESLEDQERCIAVIEALDDREGLKHAEIHADVIRRFGRFPHRNPAFGRETTREERAFLDAGGFSMGVRQ